MIDVYIAGHLTKDTKKRFDAIERFLSRFGYKVFNPAKYELETARKASLDFSMLNEAKVLFVATEKVSIGTFIEIGYMTCRKLKGEDVKIIVCYLGNDEYKGVRTVDWIRDYSPMTVYVDYVTDDLVCALDKVLEILGGDKDVWEEKES